MFVHDDDRRKLIEYAGAKVCKAIVAKKDCVVGDHYHNAKTEWFLLVSGTALVTIGDKVCSVFAGGQFASKEFEVLPGTYHRFELSAGSVLLGTASHDYDPADEVKGKP